MRSREIVYFLEIVHFLLERVHMLRILLGSVQTSRLEYVLPSPLRVQQQPLVYSKHTLQSLLRMYHILLVVLRMLLLLLWYRLHMMMVVCKHPLCRHGLQAHRHQPLFPSFAPLPSVTPLTRRRRPCR